MRRFPLHPRGTAFTLIEVMVSIALVLILVLGINQVFRLTSDTVGAGQSLASKARDYRAVQSTFYNDLSMSVAPHSVNGASMDDGPFFLIRSERMTMFRSRPDQAADRDGDPATLDADGNNAEGEPTVPGEVVRNTDLSERSHRLDRLMFFARGSFRRQTGGAVSAGGSSPFVADMSSHEAFVWYGHLQLPDYTTPSGDARQFTARRPGERVPPGSPAGTPQPKNPINFYAADWTLGRVVMALAESSPGGALADRSGTAQLFYRTGFTGSDPPLPPLHAATVSPPVRSDDGWQLEWARYDLAGASMPQLRQMLSYYADRVGPSSGARAWHHLYAPLQFQADPLPRRPVTAASLARAVPVFLGNCSSFAVEYAGDFVTQDRQKPYAPGGPPANVGQVESNGPDDVLDFVVMPDGTKDGTHNVRWYGLPRDTTGDGKVPGGQARNNDMPDVVPLRDVRRTASTRPPGEPDEAPFERMYDETGRSRLPLPSGGDYATGMAPGATYVAAWGPDTASSPRPLMLRIVFTLDDPAGRLSAAQTYQYVVKLP